MKPLQTLIIAEIANAHQGNPDDAFMLAKESFCAGASAVKFQFYSADELLVPTHSRYEHFKKQEFLSATWRQIIERINNENEVNKRNSANKDGINKDNIVWYADVFGQQSLELALELGASGVKIHSSDIVNETLLSNLAKESLTNSALSIFLSSGAVRFAELERAISLILKINKKANITLLHGFQAYPTKPKDCALCRIKCLIDTFGDFVKVGYMDHTCRESPFAFSLPMGAIALGATVIEKHISLNPGQKGTDYHSSFDPIEFRDFVSQIRIFESAFSLEPEEFSNEEKKYGNEVRKFWVANRNMQKGERINESDVVMRRIDVKPCSKDLVCNILAPNILALSDIVGRELESDVSAFEPILRLHVKERYWTFVIVRLASTRLVKKALLEVAGVPAIYHLLKKLERAKSISEVVLCTTLNSEDDVLVEIADSLGVKSFRGADADVLDRMLCAISSLSNSLGYMPDGVVRVTGDDILVDPDYIDIAIKYHRSQNADYTDLKRLPSGVESEIFSTNLLSYIKSHAMDSSGTEYLTSFVRHHSDQFKIASVPVCDKHARPFRLTLDTNEDYRVIKSFIEEMASQNKTFTYSLDDIISYFESNPELLKINSSVRGKGTPIEVNTSINWSTSL